MNAVIRHLALGIVLLLSVTACSDSGPAAPVPVASIAVATSTNTLGFGQTAQLTAIALASDGSPLGSRSVAWSSSNDAVASVSSTGLVTAGPVRGSTAATVTITASSEGRTGAVQLTIQPIPVATVTLDATSLSLFDTQTGTLVATARDETGSVLSGRAVNWTSSNTAVATVTDQGVVTGVVGGSATVAATIEGIRAQATVTVTNRVLSISSHSVAPVATSLLIGQAQTVTPTVVQPPGAPAATVTYTSTAPAVAMVSDAGVISAVAAGSAVILVTASAPDGVGFVATSTTRSVSVTVTDGCGDAAITSSSTITGFVPNGSFCQYLVSGVGSQSLRIDLTAQTYAPSLSFSNTAQQIRGSFVLATPGILSMELLTSGTTTLRSGISAGAGGDFTLRLSSSSTDRNRCSDAVAALRGVTAVRTLVDTDCLDNNTYYYDRVNIWLAAGETVTITMGSTTFDPFLNLRASNGTIIASDNNGGGGTTARIVYTATVTGNYLVDFSSNLGRVTGTYILSVQ